MHHDLISDIRRARLCAAPLPLWERRDLIRRIFNQLSDIRNAELSASGLRQNRHLGKLVNSGAHTVTHLLRLYDQEFVTMLSEFEKLLSAITDILRNRDTVLMIN